MPRRVFQWIERLASLLATRRTRALVGELVRNGSDLFVNTVVGTDVGKRVLQLARVLDASVVDRLCTNSEISLERMLVDNGVITLAVPLTVTPENQFAAELGSTLLDELLIRLVSEQCSMSSCSLAPRPCRMGEDNW